MFTFASAQPSYPPSDARHPRTLARPLDSSREPLAAPGASSPSSSATWFPANGSASGSSSGSAPQSSHIDPPCLLRSAQNQHKHQAQHTYRLSSSPHVLSHNRTPSGSCSSAPATPRHGTRALPRSEVSRHSRLHPHGTSRYRVHDSRSAPPSATMSASLPSVASLPSLSHFAHSKLTALPALDMEHDRLARACGQGPVFTFNADCVPSSSRSIYKSTRDVGEHASSSTTMSPPKVARTSSELRATAAAPPPPLNLDDTVLSVPFELGWGLRPRATSVRVSARHGAAASGGNTSAGGAAHPPHRPRSASQPASIPVFCPSSPRAVLRSLRDVLDLEGMQLEECLDVRQVFENNRYNSSYTYCCRCNISSSKCCGSI